MSSKRCTFLVTLLILIITKRCHADATHHLSKLVKICSRNDIDLNSCVLDSVMTLRPHLAKGIPELNIPSCEPLVLSEVSLVQGQGLMAMNSVYTNVQLWGFSNFTVHNMDIDLDELSMKFDVNLPKLNMKSNYSIDGKILVLPIKGNGLLYANYSNVSLKVNIHLEKIKIDHEVYGHCKEFLVELKMDKAELRLEDLFNGDKLLGKAANDFINRNWDAISEEMIPAIENMMISYFKHYTNNFFNKYPFNVLFPDK